MESTSATATAEISTGSLRGTRDGGIERYLGMRFMRPQGGLYCVVDVDRDGDQFVHEILQNTGVIFVPGSGFGPSLVNAIRVSFGPLVNDLAKIEAQPQQPQAPAVAGLTARGRSNIAPFSLETDI